MQSISRVLKALIALLCVWYLYHELFVHEKFTVLWEQFTRTTFDTIKIVLLSMAMVLVLVNWGIESAKWKRLLQKIEVLNWFKAVKSVISGVTLSIFTPNRVGEFAARIFYLQPQHRIEGVSISILGGISQLCVTQLAGSFCFAAFMVNYQDPEYIVRLLLIIFPFVFSFLVILFYFNIDLMQALLLKFNHGKKTRLLLRVFTLYSAKELFHILFLSALRFMVFSLQYYLLFQFFEINIGMLQSFLVSSSIFFVMAVIPTIAIAELGIRGATALFFLAPFSNNELSILAASYTLWCINLVLPALLGLVLLPQLSFFKK